MENILKRLIYKVTRKIMPEKKYIEMRYYMQHNKKLNLENPQSFTEKIQWQKLNGELEKLALFVDKYEVRSYVEKKVGKEYLIPLIGVYDSADEIEFDSLPNSFVVKATHSSGWNLIVRDKNNLNIKRARKQINSWIESSFYEKTGERNYKNIKGRVVIEQLIKDNSGKLKDYKIFCFNGKPKFIQVDSDRFDKHRRNLYDINWKKLNVVNYIEEMETEELMPDDLEEMLAVAEKLSGKFNFVRVDLYYTNKDILFGELTFTPGQGYEWYKPYQFDLEIGNLWKLEKS